MPSSRQDLEYRVRLWHVPQLSEEELAAAVAAAGGDEAAAAAGVGAVFVRGRAAGALAVGSPDAPIAGVAPAAAEPPEAPVAAGRAKRLRDTDGEDSDDMGSGKRDRSKL